jgi:hypothetical protein
VNVIKRTSQPSVVCTTWTTLGEELGKLHVDKVKRFVYPVVALLVTMV